MKRTKLMLCICALSFTMMMGCSSKDTNVKQEEADFSKIEIGDVIQLKGMENIIGTEFLATDVKIIRVVD